MAANQIFIQVTFGSDAANQAITTLNQNIKGIGSAAQGATAQASQGVKTFSVSIDQATRSADALAQTLTGLGIGQVVKELLGMGDSLMRIQMGFQNVAGGAGLWKQLKALAEETAFSFRSLVENANELRNAGVPIAKITSDLKALADQAAFAGEDSEGLSRAIKSISEIAAKGFVTGRELAAFRVIGLQPTKEVADALNQSIQKLRSEAHQLSAEGVLNVILDAARRQSAGAAASRAEVLPSAQFQLLRNDAEQLAGELLKALAPSLIVIVKGLRELVEIAREAVEEFKSWPQWVRTLTVALVALAVAAKAAAAAWALMAALPKIATGVEIIWATVQALVAESAAITTLGLSSSAAVPQVEALSLAMSGLAKAIAAVGAFSVGYKIGSVIREFFTGEEAEFERQKEIVKDQLVFLAESREKLASKLTGRDLAAARPRALKDYSVEQLQAQIGDYNAQIDAARSKVRILLADEAQLQREREEGLNILSEAQRKYYLVGKESIAALTYEYEQHFRKVKDSAEATANVRKALEISIATEVRKAEEERRKDSLKAVEELLALDRKVAIARASVVPDETFAGRRGLAQTTADDFEEQIRRQTYLLNQEYDRRAQAQIDALREMGGHAVQIAAFEKNMADNRVEQNAIADAKVAEHRLQSQRQINEITLEQEKQLRDQLLQQRLALIDQTTSIRAAAIGARRAETAPERLQQISDLQRNTENRIQATRDAQINAAHDALQAYESTHAGFAEGIAEEQRKFADQAAAISKQAEADIQISRIDAWREGNEAILAEQRRLYEGIQGALGRIFDALFDRSKSVWDAIGNALKTALLNAMKSIVTSRLAAMFMDLFGYGNVAFTGQTGVYGPGPRFSGAGTPPTAPPPVATPSSTLQWLLGGAGAIAPPAPPPPAVSSRGSADRMMDEGTGGADGGVWNEVPPVYTGGGAVSMASRAATMSARIRQAFGIGGVITRSNGSTVPWASATPMERLRNVLGSKGVAGLAALVGPGLLSRGFGQPGLGAAASGILGGALTGYGLATTLGSANPIGGLIGGAGVGLIGAGWAQGGAAGLGMDVAGGFIGGAGIGLAIGGPFGAAIGAFAGTIAGLGVGIARLFVSTKDEQVRSMIKQVYGVDITDRKIRQQIADLATQRYGGDIRLAVYSNEVADLVRLYALSTGQSQAGLPRPMYGVTMAQSAAGGLQTQAVYSGGALVASPYTGTTTTDLQNSLLNPSVYVQLNPQQAQSLFEGRVTQVISSNPGTVAAANTAAARSGQSRTAQTNAFLEPLTVTR
jgi:hypothetical protein